MPLLGSVLVAAIFLGLAQKPKFTVSITIFALLASVYVTDVKSDDKNSNYSFLRYSFPSYRNWLPKQQPYLNGYKDIITWLTWPQNSYQTFCVVASSGKINQGIFDEIWQVFPTMVTPDFASRQIHLNQVDSSQGPPGPNIGDCDIALLGLPFQTHLPQMQQFNLQILHDDILSGTGIGTVFGRVPVKFRMSDDVSVLAFQRIHDVSPAIYSDLVYRYRLAKENVR
jgi:hypothetical protein